MRLYLVTFENVAVSAAQDLLQIKGASGKMLQIVRQWVELVDVSLPAAQGWRLRSRFLPATVTDGSGGSTPTPVAQPGDAAASFTALANNTTQATTNGTAKIHWAGGGHIYSGSRWTFQEMPAIGPSESFVFELLSTPSGTIHLSGGVEVIEIGG